MHNKIKASLAALTLAVGLGLSGPAQAAGNAGPPAPTRSDTPAIGKSGSKGLMPKQGVTAPKLLLSTFKYAGGQDTPATSQTLSYANMTVAKPSTVAADHSLFELSVQGGTANKALVLEIGWNVDPTLYGDSDPHLFMYSWLNGTPRCYNGCGLVDYAANPINFGANLATVAATASPGNIKKFGIQWDSANGGLWWFWYDTAFVGYIPDDIWQTATPAVPSYNYFTFAQAFMEVYSASGTSCTDGGNGIFSVNTTAAGIYSWAYASPNVPNSTWTVQSHPAEYTSTYLSGRSAREGGPGPC